jgi:hypothetical protein
VNYLDERNARCLARWVYLRRLEVRCADPLKPHERAWFDHYFAPRYTAALQFLAHRSVERGRNIVLFRRSRA